MTKKKKVYEYTSGCTCFSTNVDGKELVDMEADEIRKHLYHLIDKVEDTAVLQDMFESILSSIGEYEDLGHCECCGDYICSYTYKE